MITMLIYSLFAVSYNIIFGQGGQLSFGHAAYFGTGAYTCILLIKYFECSLPLSIAASGLSGGLLGLLLGAFIVRMKGVPFALITLAFNQLIYISAEKFRGITGGEDGVAAYRPNFFIGGLEIDLFSTINWYYFVLFLVIVCIFFCWYFTQTPLGRLNFCLRDNEERVNFIGYNSYLSRLLIYGFACFFAGVAGGLASSFQEFVTTTFINLDKSSEVLMMTFIGGGGNFIGPIIGAFSLTFFNDIISGLTERWSLIQGILFIILVLYAPNGLSGIYRSVKDKYMRR
ncbi:MAG: branched-chain amino acid ABC transporter permease [Desulfohalobiaceae bacterium]|nr:branched-chain amino acid ABC transporter permease [Desulfohalobiaceae bacterium]